MNSNSIIKSMSAVHRKFNQSTFASPSSRLKWKGNDTREFFGDLNQSLPSSRGKAQFWNARRLRLRNSAEKSSPSRIPSEHHFWRNSNVNWRRQKRSPHRLGDDDAGLTEVKTLNAMPNLMLNEAEQINRPTGVKIPTPESPLITVSIFEKFSSTVEPE
jgi:hypothetical protein